MPGARDPFPARHPWYALIEASGAKADGEARAALESMLATAVEDGLVTDVVMAETLAHARDLWRLREAVSEAQKPEGGNIKHDVSVPVARIPAFVREADAAVERIVPGARSIPVGHFGDGNIHYNIAQPPGMDKAAFLALTGRVNAAVHAVVLHMGGSIAAEHGVGRQKRAELARTKQPVELEMMRGIKTLFDPNGILNPGKVV
jgi:FAD/FMN-containing dehydrogenase